MPVSRILAVALIGIGVFVGVLWSMDVNYPAWLGVWMSPNNQFTVGLVVILLLGLALTWVYASYIGETIPGHGVVRGIAFAVVLAAFAIWGLPQILSGLASTIGNTQVVYQGRGITNDEKRYDEGAHLVRVNPVPRPGGMEPPLAFLTRDHEWAPADAWKGRVLPLGVAFLIWGSIIGAFLSEKQR